MDNGRRVRIAENERAKAWMENRQKLIPNWNGYVHEVRESSTQKSNNILGGKNQVNEQGIGNLANGNNFQITT